MKYSSIQLETTILNNCKTVIEQLSHNCRSNLSLNQILKILLSNMSRLIHNHNQEEKEVDKLTKTIKKKKQVKLSKKNMSKKEMISKMKNCPHLLARKMKIKKIEIHWLNAQTIWFLLWDKPIYLLHYNQESQITQDWFLKKA